MVVAFEGDPVDHRVFDHAHGQTVAFAADVHVGEQAGGEQSLQRFVDLAIVEGIPFGHRQVGFDRLGFDALITGNEDLADRAPLLGERSICGHQRYRRHSHGQRTGMTEQEPPCWVYNWDQEMTRLMKSHTRKSKRSLRVVKSIKANTRNRPRRKPYSCARAPSGRPRRASIP